MKIAVTGATGFIGGHVLAELRHHPVEVIAVTRNAGKLGGRADRVRVVEMDIADPPEDSYVRLGRPDVLMHLAWAGLPHYMSLHHFEIELPRNYRFLKDLVEAGLSAALVTGTCFEYGMQSGALSEDLPAMPTTPYGHSKDALRRQLGFLRGACGFSLTWARLFFMFGEGQGEKSLFSQLRRAVTRGDARFNMSGGEQLRDFLPVTDVSRYLVALAVNAADTGVVNICAGEPVSVRTLVEGWIGENGWDIELNLGFYPYPVYEPMAFWGDRRKLDRLAGRHE
jgi:dTDP-6-deoxy-L-talose 4-dehydrogenase (NAD+)